MTIFNVISLAGGLALFLYGMSIMGTGLEKYAGGRMESILQKLTSSTWRAVFAVRRLFSAENRPARMHSSVRRGAVFLFSYERLRPSPGFPAAVYNTSASTAPASR